MAIMKKWQAKEILRGKEGLTIRRVYAMKNVAPALRALNPGFSYHDWNYRTIREFLVKFS